MNLLYRRPLLCFCIGWILSVGLLYASLLHDPVVIAFSKRQAALLLGVAFMLGLGGVLLRHRYPSGEGHRLLFFGAAGLLLGMAVCLFHPINQSLQRAQELAADGQVHTVEAVLRQDQYQSGETLLGQAEIVRIDGDAIPALRVSLQLEACAGLECGDSFTAKVKFLIPEQLQGGSPHRSVLAAGGIFAEASGEYCAFLHKASGYSGAVLQLRTALRRTLQANLSEESAGLALALLLGDRSDLPAGAKRDFRTLGISHLLAVSGLHLMILIGMFSRLLRRYRLPKVARFSVQMLLVAIYILLSGCSGSILRAGLMYLLFLCGELFGKKSDGVTALCSAVTWILLVEPYRVLDTGLQLSFFATLGIFTLGRELLSRKAGTAEPEKASHPWLRRTWEAFAISLAAVIFTFPVSVWMTGRFSLLGPIATLLFAPLFSLLLQLLPMALLLSPIPFLRGLCFFLVEEISSGILRLAGFAYWGKSTSLPIPDRQMLICGGMLLILLLVLCLPIRKKWLRLLPVPTFAVVLLVGGVMCLMPTAPQLLHTQSESGNSESYLLRCDSNTVLIDLTTGGKELYRSAENALYRLHTSGIDSLVLTHLHQRHASALAWLSENDYLDRVYLPSPQTASEEAIFENLMAVADRFGISVTVYGLTSEQSSLVFGEVTWIPMPRVYLKRSTHPCIGFLLQTGKTGLLCLGGSYPAAALPAELLSDVDALLLGVHGPIAKPDDDRDYATVLPPQVEWLPSDTRWIRFQ